MHYYSKALPLVLPLILAACGVASPDNPNAVIAVPTDQIPPEVLSISPADKAEVSLSIDKITVKFSEALDPALVAAASGLTVSPALPNMKIEYDSAASTAVVTWDKTTLPYNTDYTVTVSAALADLAGNKLKSGKTFSFRTLTAVKLKGTVTGLAQGQTITLIEKNFNKNASSAPVPIEVKSDKPGFLFPILIPSGSNFSVAITSQPGSKRDYCSVRSGSGTAGDQEISLNVVCGKVLPFFASAPNWNDYIALDGGTDPLKASGTACREDASPHAYCYHAGELRMSYVPATLIEADGTTTCAHLKAIDHLGWFDWQCMDTPADTTGRFRMVATKLKSSVNLSSLVSTGSLSWNSNMVMFENTKTGAKVDDTNTTTNPGIPWWNNPVVEGTTPYLNQAGTVYVLRAKSGSEVNVKSYVISADRIAAITSGSLHPTPTTTAVISAAPTGGTVLSFLWLEADVDAAGSSTGLQLKDVAYTVLRNSSVKNASVAGIGLEHVYASILHNVNANNNLGNGITVNGANPPGAQFGNVFDSITAAGNAGHGIQISTRYNKLHGIRAAGNTGDGILVEEAINTLTNVASFDNAGNGLTLSGAINTTVVGASLASNGKTGVRLAKYGPKSASGNVFANITSILNRGDSTDNGDGIAVSDDVGNSLNSFFRVFSALNHGNGLSVGTNVTTSTFTNSLAALNGANCNIQGTSSCASGISTANSTLGQTFAIDYTGKSYLKNDVLAGFTVKANSAASLTVNSATGPCDGGCSELDLRLKTGDSLALGKFTAASDVESHTYLGASAATTFLANASEIIGDNIGNDNGLCESNETCVHNANIGAYQGEDTWREIIGDNIDNENGLCEANEKCAFNPSWEPLTDIVGTGATKWETMNITLRQPKANGY